MSLSHIVELLTKGGVSASRFRRAIRLFEFQVSLFYPYSFKKLAASQDDVAAPTKKLRTARIFAAMKILEQIEADLKLKKNCSVISIRELATDEDYRAVFDEMMVTAGGWSQIMGTQSVRKFANDIRALREEARVAANIVDFSYRFSGHYAGKIFDKRRNPGGVQAAKYVVRQSYKPHVGRSTMKNRWRKYQSPAIFLYLMLNQKMDVEPPRANSKSFLKRLLQQADNLDELQRLFPLTRRCVPPYCVKDIISFWR